MRDGSGQRKPLCFQIVCEALRRSAHGVNVHTVRACAQNAAQTAGPEGKVAAKRLPPLLFVHSLQLRQQLRLCDVCKPA